MCLSGIEQARIGTLVYALRNTSNDAGDLSSARLSAIDHPAMREEVSDLLRGWFKLNLR